VFTRVVGCTCIQQGLERLHHDAHVWSKVSFILHTECGNSCKLFEQQKEQENVINKGFKTIKILPPFQIVSHSGISRYIIFAMHLNIHYV